MPERKKHFFEEEETASRTRILTCRRKGEVEEDDAPIRFKLPKRRERREGSKL